MTPFLVHRQKTDTLYCSMKCLVTDGGNIMEALTRFTTWDVFNYYQEWQNTDDPENSRAEAGLRWGAICPICEREYDDVLPS